MGMADFLFPFFQKQVSFGLNMVITTSFLSTNFCVSMLLGSNTGKTTQLEHIVDMHGMIPQHAADLSGLVGVKTDSSVTANLCIRQVAAKVNNFGQSDMASFFDNPYFRAVLCNA